MKLAHDGHMLAAGAGNLNATSAIRRDALAVIKRSAIAESGVGMNSPYVVQQKTAKASDMAWIRFKVTPELQRVISHCRDNIVSPFLIHRRPDRKKQKQAETKDHWTKIEERYLTRAFKEAREAADCYKGWKEEEMPGFHEVRALSLHLYKKAGKDGQKIAGHASEEHDQKLSEGSRGSGLVRGGPRPRYQRNRRIVLRQFCAGFAPTRNEKGNQACKWLIPFTKYGRDGVIRTLDP
jgi:hypothetical protein